MSEQERTCFQTGQTWSGVGNLGSDVAIVYGIDARLPERIATWREQGYRIHVMTGVSWGHYQDYLYGRFDGVNHEDEAQTERNGRKISHGGDVYYMCPGTNYGRFLATGVQRALDAGAEAIHLEEPEFWVRAGYSEGFKREWRAAYGEDWQPPHASVDAQWRASKLKYNLYRRALQQVFDHVQDFNARTGREVRCYVPTHSLLNYAHWNIVSPESSLARLRGCDGYIAQVWTGTSRTPNVYRGVRRERTFETAFLEYGAMQNLVRATGRGVWYLNDPIEDNPDHDWTDYKVNWESTLVASLLQSDVWHYEVAPWPERVFSGRYPAKAPAEKRFSIPAGYATELQVVMNALNDLKQERVDWHGAMTGVGVVVSDSLMFERGQPTPSDPHLGQVYGLALPFVKRGVPITPVQLENVVSPGYLRPYRLLLLSYRGQKPLSPEVHAPIARWVREGGTLVVCDDDQDPYGQIREWWNEGERRYSNPREHLFESLGIRSETGVHRVGKGRVLWLQEDPASIASAPDGGDRLIAAVRSTLPASWKWHESNQLLLRRGRYVIAAGLDESISDKESELKGAWIDLFDPELRVQSTVKIRGGARRFLLDLKTTPQGRVAVLASAGRAHVKTCDKERISLDVRGVSGTRAVVLIQSPRPPRQVGVDGAAALDTRYAAGDGLLWIWFDHHRPAHALEVRF